MLFEPTTAFNDRWSACQQPLYESVSSSGHLGLIDALNNGYQITDVTLIHNTDSEDDYSIGLFHSQKRTRYSMNLHVNAENAGLLRNEDATIIDRQSETMQ